MEDEGKVILENEVKELYETRIEALKASNGRVFEEAQSKVYTFLYSYSQLSTPFLTLIYTFFLSSNSFTWASFSIPKSFRKSPLNPKSTNRSPRV
jgi:hypothetical protein